MLKIEEEAKKFERYLAQLGYVKVTRCKNCVHGNNHVSEFGMPEITCEVTDAVEDSEWFCPEGEPR